MITLPKTGSLLVSSVSTDGRNIEELLNKEWLLTNSRGGYASSTIIGCNTSRYHGLLIASLNPPVNRIMALANCMEMVIYERKAFDLSTFEFNEKFAPEGFGYTKHFYHDYGVHFDFQLCGIELTKSIYLLRDSDTVALVYDFKSVREPAEFALRPFVALRNFHALQKSYAQFHSTWLGSCLVIGHNIPKTPELLVNCSSMNFVKDEQWWFNFLYRKDRERGQDYNEDLWTPGFFKSPINAPGQIVLWASLSTGNSQEPGFNIKTEIANLLKHQNALSSAVKTRDEKLKKLYIAADQFIATRQQTQHPPTEPGSKTAAKEKRTTILAGFPWFADWGRDAFISLPGLLLSTGKLEEAKSVLVTFANVAADGLIPNHFDDNTNVAYFNSIDASLWFIHAAFQYYHAGGDKEAFNRQLLPIIRWIIESYHNGTRFDTRADDDGLITSGSEETQLTWMDAKCDGTALTSRHGKAVEINALWYNNLCHLAQFYADDDTEAAKHYHSMADKVEAGFIKAFANEITGYLNDCVRPDGSIDATLRPNQIFAVSLPFSPLPLEWQKKVVDTVREKLLTPYGVRTLESSDSRYKGQYTGPSNQRDEAYHQGTVWPYLMGPFIESYLKVNDFSNDSRKKAAEFIEPLLRHFAEDGCLGQISEIFDGDAPHKPKGCLAQAWSVAELIRGYHLIND
ncbi:MAG: amylo-alpha-1,6-glucosidase [Planctomycetota bacterium]